MSVPNPSNRAAPSGPVLPSGAVSSVAGSDGLTPTTPQTGAVVLSGAALLPLDGSRAMTGALDMGGNSVGNASTYNGVALTTAGPGTNFLADDGTYKAVGGGAVASVQGADGITPAAPQVGVVVLSGAALLPLDGSRAMTGALDMGAQAITNASSGSFSGAVTGATFNGVGLTTGGPGTNFLADDGTYKAVGGGAVASVEGSNGITPSSPQTGVVVLSGADLLPLDGSRAMTGNLAMGGNNIVGAGSGAFTGNVNASTFNGVGLTTGGPGTNFLADDGTYKAVGGGAVASVQGSNGITPSSPQTGVVVLSGADLLPLDGSRAMTGALDMGAQAITNASSGAFSGAVTGATFNGAPITSGGGGSLFLADDGTYKNPAAVPSTVGGVETFSAINASGNEFMTNNTAFGRLYAMAVIPNETLEVDFLQFLIAQNNGGGTLGVGIYNGAGVRLAYSSLQAVVLGVNKINLNNGGPVTLMGGQLYYFCIESNINACAPISIQAASVYNPPVGANVFPLAFFVPNSRSVDASGFPADISAFFGQVGNEARKYWVVGTPT